MCHVPRDQYLHLTDTNRFVGSGGFLNDLVFIGKSAIAHYTRLWWIEYNPLLGRPDIVLVEASHVLLFTLDTDQSPPLFDIYKLMTNTSANRWKHGYGYRLTTIHV